MRVAMISSLVSSLLVGCSGTSAVDAGQDDSGSALAPCAGQVDGTLCMQGRVCIGGACVESRCGDGVLDSRSEQCDDGNDVAADGCRSDCVFTCADDAACGDDNPCNGTERCTATHTCEAGDPLLGGTECTSGAVTGVCRLGACVARCDPTAPFGAPVPLDALNTDSSEQEARLGADELSIYFASNRPGGFGGYDIYVATRTAPDAPFGEPALVPGVNTDAGERAPSISGDGLTLYAMTLEAGVWHLARATRSSSDASFSALVPVSSLNGDSSNPAPYVLPDHHAIYFESDRGGTGYDIYRAPYHESEFGLPALVGGANLATPDWEDSPAVTPDELVMVFGSNRAGGQGDLDIHMATRASSADAFDAPIPLDSLNSPLRDRPTWISSDGCELHLSRGELSFDGSWTFDLFVATRGH